MKNLSRDDQNRKLIKEAQAGDINSRNKLYELNKGLILKMAGNLSKNRRDRKNVFDDYSQQAYLGFIRAIDRYNLSNPIEFSTYASRVMINDLISYGEREIKLIKGPKSENTWKNYIDSILKDHPDANYKKISKELCARKNIRITPYTVYCIFRFFRLKFISLEKIMEYIDIEDKSLEVKGSNGSLYNKVRDNISQLPLINQDIINRHYGLNGNPCESVKKIAYSLNLSKSTIYNQLKRAHNKLRELSK